jgi:hypothetical protein
MKRIALLFVPVAFLGACVVEVDHRHSGPGTTPTTTPTNPAPQTPLLVTVDTDKVMNATAGDGVGVFIEYKAGGTWHVWWTCDTNKSGKPCAFDVKAIASTGTITNLKPDALLATDQSTQLSDTSIEVKANTSTAAAGVFFNTDAGARITIDATIGDVPKAGDYLFFVQDGQVNGGYKGVVTNPLQLEPSTP